MILSGGGIVFSQRMLDALNKQINHETFSSYLYLAMAANFDAMGLKGFANWMAVQAKEEAVHAEMFFNYVLERSGRVHLLQIAEPQQEWATPLAAFQAALEHEEFITKCINDLTTLALDDKDHATVSFLKWFVDEQVEEVSTADQVVTSLKFIGDDRSALFYYDRELAQRQFVRPAAAGA
jgi:ferritin